MKMSPVANADAPQRQPAAALTTTQRQLGSTAGQPSALQAHVDRSPRLLAQRRALESAFCHVALQRQADGVEDSPPKLVQPVAQRGQSRGAVGDSVQFRERGQRPVIQRVIYANVPALLAAVWPGPGPVPIVATFSEALQALFADAENQLALTDIVLAPGIGRIAEAGLNPAGAPPYILNYDPAQAAGDLNFLLASMLHELLHVSTQENYRKNGVPFDFLNMNLPAGLAVPAGVGVEINAQIAILSQNLQDAVAVATADGTLTVAMRNHILGRLNNYALPMPDVHYDTVLADVLAYMELGGVNAGPTFTFMTRLIKESTNRRLVDPWWGTKSARRVDRNKRSWQFWKW